MTHQDQARVSVRIMEKEFVVACPYDERSALLDAAEFLNARMRDIRETGKVVGLDRIAVMAALNLAHEFLKGKDRELKLDSGVGQRVRALRERVEGALEKTQQLEL
jgi:cell division protein ZapA